MGVGERLAALRKSRGWTQVQLAEQSQLSASAIAMYETNRRTPDSRAAEKLAQALDVNLTSLTESPGPKEQTEAQSLHSAAAAPGAGLTSLALTRDEAKFILLLRMNSRVRAFVESYMAADDQQRSQLDRTWRLIQDFHQP